MEGAWNWIWRVYMEVRDLRLRDLILQFRVQKGTSIWLLCLLCSSFSLLLVLPFLCLTVEEMKWASFFSLQFLFFFFFCFLNFEFYENPTMKKMVFALLILHFKSPSNFSLYTLFLSRKRKWQRSDKIKNIDIVTFQFVKVIYSN